MLKCVLIDDEPLAIKLLTNYVNITNDLNLAASFTNAIEALHYLEKEEVDLIFLDIQMPDLTGIQLGKVLNGRIPIVFTTAYEKYALEGYELDVVDYLLKPISFERFLIAVQKAKQRKVPAPNQGAPQSQDKGGNTPSHIFVKTSYKTQRIDLADILYFEGLSDYVRIHTKSGRILTLETMKSFMATLPNDNFVRVHRSYIVAIDKIDFIERNRIIIHEERIPIGATYQQAFWSKIGSK